MKMAKYIAASLMMILVVAIAFAHWVLPGLLEGRYNLVKEHSPYGIRPEVQAFHDQLFIADLHSDSLLWKRDLLMESDIGHVDLKRLKKVWYFIVATH